MVFIRGSAAAVSKHGRVPARCGPGAPGWLPGSFLGAERRSPRLSVKQDSLSPPESSSFLPSQGACWLGTAGGGSYCTFRDPEVCKQTTEGHSAGQRRSSGAWRLWVLG